jgi:hypothetical protein
MVRAAGASSRGSPSRRPIQISDRRGVMPSPAHPAAGVEGRTSAALPDPARTVTGSPPARGRGLTIAGAYGGPLPRAP